MTLEEQLKRLWQRGREAWKHVPKASDWVDDIRGNKRGIKTAEELNREKGKSWDELTK